jgi:hypothetical protein
VQAKFALEKRHLEEYITDEMDPNNQNDSLFEKLRQNRNWSLKTELKTALAGVGGNIQSNDTPTAAGDKVKGQVGTIIDAILFDRNQQKSVDEHVAEEMEAVLDAYRKVAMDRLIDCVPKKVPPHLS